MSEAFAAHLHRPLAIGHIPEGAFTGAAGGAACGDLIRVSIAVDEGCGEGTVLDAGFDASGCGAVVAAGSAAVSLLRGAPLLRAARIAPQRIAEELGGLTPAKMHAAELACDALHRALGQAARAGVSLTPSPVRGLVAMSGGVDSAVAALMSIRDGGETVAVTLELWADAENDAQRSCCSALAVRSARSLAHRLGLPHLSIDLREQFREGVVKPWLSEHAAGLTPNPCVRCNGRVRLDGMLQIASRLGAPTLATGHYARVQDGLLMVATDERKDQSYALAALPRDSLARMRFPLGDMSKEQAREIARRAGLAVARRPDSQDLCFLAGTSKPAFLARHGGLSDRPGAIVHADGRVLGEHDGAHRFTVGQRRGLRLGGGEPLYVLEVDAQANRVIVGHRDRLRTDRLALADAVLHRDGGSVDAVKINYRGARRACTLQESAGEGRHERLTVSMADPIQRTAPGQLACLYSGEMIVGHGTIL